MNKSLEILKYRVSGGALYFAIFVMLLLSMLSIALLSFFELSFKEDYIFQKAEEIQDNIFSTIELLSCQPELVQVGEHKTVDLFGDGSALVDVDVQWWGMLRKGTIQASWRHLKESKIVLFAEKEKVRPALWMPDKGRYVSLVGNSFINGDCYLSELGIRKGNAEGRYFQGPFLHKGNLEYSAKRMPPIKQMLQVGINGYLSGTSGLNDSLVSYQEVKRQKITNQSFKGKTLFVNGGQRLLLQDGAFSGNVILYASDTIEVWPSCMLDGVILAGGTIIFQKGFKGKVQAFAMQGIETMEGCTFSYPSFLVCVAHNPKVSAIIGSNNNVNGGVLVYSNSPKEGETSLTVSSNAIINGKVYVNGDISFKGHINGSLYCDRFVFLSSRAFYENFMIDCSIDESKLPIEYSSYCFTDDVHKLRFISQCQ